MHKDLIIIKKLVAWLIYIWLEKVKALITSTPFYFKSKNTTLIFCSPKAIPIRFDKTKVELILSNCNRLHKFFTINFYRVKFHRKLLQNKKSRLEWAGFEYLEKNYSLAKGISTPTGPLGSLSFFSRSKAVTR